MFVGDDVFKTVHELSGGQKARLELTKLSFQPINFLILDEPTNHLDIDSREVLETAINEFSGTVLFVSHDRYFLNQVATDILDMSATGIQHYSGNYDSFLEQTAKLVDPVNVPKKAATKKHSSKSTGQQNYQASKQEQRARRKLEREVSKWETTLDQLQTQHDQIEQQMSEPEIATDIAKLSDLQKKLDQCQTELDQAEENWTRAAEQLEEFNQ